MRTYGINKFLDTKTLSLDFQIYMPHGTKYEYSIRYSILKYHDQKLSS